MRSLASTGLKFMTEAAPLSSFARSVQRLRKTYCCSNGTLLWTERATEEHCHVFTKATERHLFLIQKAIKKYKITIKVLANFSKAFDTIYFNTVIKKMSQLGFSKAFLVWITSYL